MWRRSSKTMVSGLDAQQSELIFRVHTCLSLADAHWLWQENHSDAQFSRKPRETFPNWYLTNRKKRNTAYLHGFSVTVKGSLFDQKNYPDWVAILAKEIHTKGCRFYIVKESWVAVTRIRLKYGSKMCKIIISGC